MTIDVIGIFTIYSMTIITYHYTHSGGVESSEGRVTKEVPTYYKISLHMAYAFVRNVVHPGKQEKTTLSAREDRAGGAAFCQAWKCAPRAPSKPCASRHGSSTVKVGRKLEIAGRRCARAPLQPRLRGEWAPRRNGQGACIACGALAGCGALCLLAAGRTPAAVPPVAASGGMRCAQAVPNATCSRPAVPACAALPPRVIGPPAAALRFAGTSSRTCTAGCSRSSTHCSS